MSLGVFVGSSSSARAASRNGSSAGSPAQPKGIDELASEGSRCKEPFLV